MNRAKIVAHRQDVRLVKLGIARTWRPGGPATLESATVPILAILAAAEHTLELARLARMAAPEAEDPAHRRLVVIAGAVASAIASDIKGDDTTSTTALYLAITAMQNDRED